MFVQLAAKLNLHSRANRVCPKAYRYLPSGQARIAGGVVLRAANQNRSIAGGNRTKVHILANEITSIIYYFFRNR